MGRILLGVATRSKDDSLQSWCRLLNMRVFGGPTAYIVLTVLVLQHPVFSNHAITVTGNVFFGLSVSGLCNIAAFFALAVLYAWKRFVPHGSVYQAILTGALATGIVIELVLEVTGASSVTLSLSADVLCGVSLGGIGVEQVRRFSEASSRCAAANLLAVMFLSAALLLLASVLNNILSALLSLLLVAISALTLPWDKRNQERASRYGADSKILIPRKLVMTIVVQGLSTGLIQGAFTAGGWGNFFLIEGLSLGCASIVAIVFFWWLHRDFNHLLYVIAFPLMALGHLGAALIGNNVFVVLVHETGYRFIMFLSWMLAVWVIKHKELSANWVWPCVMCSFVGGRVAGVFFGTLIDSQFGAESVVFGQMIMVFVVLFSALLLFGSASLGDGWGMTSAADDGEGERSDRLEVSIDLVAHEYGLTPREIEIVTLLARGRDQVFIADYLHISVDTVKTHRRSIYRKLDIHSHQDLLTLLEDARTSLSDEASSKVSGPDTTLLT